MNYSLVIPCYNEEKNLPILIKKYKRFLKYPKNKLILVNNGSTDHTEKFLKKLNKIRNIKTVKIKKNIGFGYGLKKGILASNGKIVIYSHADLEVNPNDIFKAIKLFEKNNFDQKIFIKGLRVNKIKNNWSYLNIFFSLGLTFLSSIIFRRKIIDVHAVPVLFSKNLFKNLNYYPNDFSIDLSIYINALEKNYTEIRFPVNFNKKKRKYGKGNNDNLPKMIKNSFQQFYQLFRILIKK
jgi:glycosyltransferase involved in cell wall biosynthesis